MICKIQVVTIGEDGREETCEITSIQGTDVKPETLGLALAEGKIILRDLQQGVVESQVSSLVLPKRTCPECGEPRCGKGNHTLSVRTVFGRLTVRSPRLFHCVCRPHDTKTFSPLAGLLPNHTLPELLFLETKWASLMSYGMTSKLLQDVLPIDEPVNTFTIRQHVADVAERLEQEMATNNSVSSRAASGAGTDFRLPMVRLPSGSMVAMSAGVKSKDGSRSLPPRASWLLSATKKENRSCRRVGEQSPPAWRRGKGQVRSK